MLNIFQLVVNLVHSFVKFYFCFLNFPFSLEFFKQGRNLFSFAVCVTRSDAKECAEGEKGCSPLLVVR